jgi:hypothetical protein
MGVAFLISMFWPFEMIRAGQWGQIARIVSSHRSSMARNRRGRLYSTQPS